MQSLTVTLPVPPALFCKVASTLLRSKLPQWAVEMATRTVVDVETRTVVEGVKAKQM